MTHDELNQYANYVLNLSDVNTSEREIIRHLQTAGLSDEDITTIVIHVYEQYRQHQKAQARAVFSESLIYFLITGLLLVVIIVCWIYAPLEGSINTLITPTLIISWLFLQKGIIPMIISIRKYRHYEALTH